MVERHGKSGCWQIGGFQLSRVDAAPTVSRLPVTMSEMSSTKYCSISVETVSLVGHDFPSSPSCGLHQKSQATNRLVS